MAEYSFVTVWRHQAPIEAVYDAIADSLRWPEWWSTVKRVDELVAGDPATGDGSIRRYTFKGSLPYTLSFDMAVSRMERPQALAGSATGELEGTGVWTLTEEAGGVTVARYDWNVRTTRWWMNLLGPIARPIFKANHDLVMGRGRRACAIASAGLAARAPG